jgi:hypothetical protein
MGAKKVQDIGDDGLRPRTRVEETKPSSNVHHAPLVEMCTSMAYIINPSNSESISQPTYTWVFQLYKVIVCAHVEAQSALEETGFLDIYLLILLVSSYAESTHIKPIKTNGRLAVKRMLNVHIPSGTA